MRKSRIAPVSLSKGRNNRLGYLFVLKEKMWEQKP